MNISANEGDNTDSCKNNINISQNDNNWPIIITNNSITLSKDNCRSKSFENNSQLQIALTEKEERSQKEKIKQFQFRFIKRKLGVDDFENISGTSYEDFVRKSFKIMFMIISQDDLYFEKPKKFSINRFLVDYLNNSINDSLRIKTNIHDIIKKGLIKETMQIDTVTEFNYKVMKNQ